MNSKLAIGTVQFGLNYGINNTHGKVKSTEVGKILDYCKLNNINTIDTAYAYGDSESVLGSFNLTDFNIVSKLPKTYGNSVTKCFNESIQRLKVRSLYAYMLHDFSTYEEKTEVWDELKILKKAGKIEKIGFSLYYPKDLQTLLLEKIDFDIIQIPYNLFDRRFEPYFKTLNKLGIEIHSRSTFLQGLFYKEINKLPQHFNDVKLKLRLIETFRKKRNLTITEVCLGFVLSNKLITKTVIGVDTKEQLVDNKNVSEKVVVEYKWDELKMLKIDDAKILNPSLWKL